MEPGQVLGAVPGKSSTRHKSEVGEEWPESRTGSGVLGGIRFQRSLAPVTSWGASNTAEAAGQERRLSTALGVAPLGALCWAQPFQKDVKVLNCTQRRAAKLMTGLGAVPEPLSTPCLPRVGQKRLRGDLIALFFLGRGSGEGGAGFFSSGSSGRTPGNGSELCQGSFRLDTRKNSFTERVIRAWDRLLQEVLHAPSLPGFKRHLDHALMTDFSLVSPELSVQLASMVFVGPSQAKESDLPSCASSHCCCRQRLSSPPGL